MVDFRFRARAWVFGSDIDTDQIVPGQYLTSPVEEQSRHAFEAISAGFAEQFRKGILTHEAGEAAVQKAIAEIDGLDIVTDRTVKIRILSESGEE